MRVLEHPTLKVTVNLLSPGTVVLRVLNAHLAATELLFEGGPKATTRS